MKNMKVASKLIVSFLIVIALSIIIGVVGIIGMSTMNQAGSDMYDFNVGSIMALGNLRENLALQRNDLRDIFLSQDDPNRVSQMIAEVKRLGQDAEANFTLYETTIFDMSEEDDYFKAKDTWFGSFVEMKNNVYALIDQGNFDEAYSTFRAVINDISVITEGLNSAAARNEAAAATSNTGMDSTYRMLSILMISVIVLAAAIALGLAFYISGLISKPLGLLTTFMKRAGGTGDITLGAEDERTIGQYGQMKDEIGQCIGATGAFIGHVIGVSKLLEHIADGDLRDEVKLLSATDTLGISLNKTLQNLNGMFGEINNSTAQVSSGSKQIADGAQTLAQGSTEQAAAVEQLSASITEIAQKTKDNADMAGRTAELATSIKQSAEKGSRQMDEMLAAVKEINEAGKNISRVIKVIDDIAFQTNILALNAAVEAARAGQHGKGFAVVAEEVRSLAAKSADAAKETGTLIANSTEKAELGSRIASETAISLSEIVSGINESNQFIHEIAQSSEQQSAGITQINTGVDQVAQVIQQNSATAEESAAASEEMSGQANMLEDLIAQFKLKDGGGTRRSLSSPSPRKQIAMPEKAELPNSGEYGKY